MKMFSYVWAESTTLLQKGKYHCMFDLLFDWFGFNCFPYVEIETYLLVWSNPSPSNRKSTSH